MFGVGDTVVYPQHGAGRILDIVQKDFMGKLRDYLLIEILPNRMTVMVPADGIDKAGIRPVMSEERAEEVLRVLRDKPTKMPLIWSRRVRQNTDKIRSGDILEIADVLRNLAARARERGLSTGEKQMYMQVRHVVTSELMCAKGLTEAQAGKLLDGILDRDGGGQPPLGASATAQERR
ncbi:MAG: CarD family transcriptional regulator [Actinobacteria bacterium]|nr:CarD family transcriptional regulator [Actinomycetota bacterium]